MSHDPDKTCFKFNFSFYWGMTLEHAAYLVYSSLHSFKMILTLYSTKHPRIDLNVKTIPGISTNYQMNIYQGIYWWHLLTDKTELRLSFGSSFINQWIFNSCRHLILDGLRQELMLDTSLPHWKHVYKIELDQMTNHSGSGECWECWCNVMTMSEDISMSHLGSQSL